MFKIIRLALLGSILFAPSFAQRTYDIEGPMELYIWLTAKPGEGAALEKTFREVFYPAVSARPGFRSAAMVRKPGTSEYTVRLSFLTEKARLDWVASDPHQKAWPALSSHASKFEASGFAVIHPK